MIRVSGPLASRIKGNDVATRIQGDQRSALLGIPVVHRGLQELD
jgi:hypothetical protein